MHTMQYKKRKAGYKTPFFYFSYTYIQIATQKNGKNDDNIMITMIITG